MYSQHAQKKISKAVHYSTYCLKQKGIKTFYNFYKCNFSTCGFFPDIFREDEEAFFQQLWKLVHENVFSTVKHLFEKEYTHSEVEMFISRHRPSSFTSDKLIGMFILLWYMVQKLLYLYDKK